MRRAERLFRPVNELRTRSVTRAEDLAKHFEVSVRTVYRDLSHLQALLEKERCDTELTRSFAPPRANRNE